MCYSWLSSRIYCYARVIDDTCNTSAADINVLKTVIYSLKLSNILSASCPLGESQTRIRTTTSVSIYHHLVWTFCPRWEFPNIRSSYTDCSFRAVVVVVVSTLQRLMAD